MKSTVIYNPNATGMHEDVLKRMDATLEGQNIEVSNLESKYPGNSIELVKQANEDSDLIVTMGGDGTLGEAFKAFGEVEQRAHYAHISTGTANDTANNLGLFPESVSSSVKLYEDLNKLMIVPVDMLTANGVPFSYVSCCGTFTNLTYETPKILKQAFGKMGYYLFSGLRGVSCLFDVFHKPLKLSYKTHGEKKNTSALTMIVSNTKTFAGFKLFPNANIDDGKFEVTILKNLPGIDTLKAVAELLCEDGTNFNFEDYSAFIDTFETDEFTVTFENSNPNLTFNHDGDQAIVPLDEDNRVEYKISKRVKMLLPQRAIKK